MHKGGIKKKNNDAWGKENRMRAKGSRFTGTVNSATAQTVVFVKGKKFVASGKSQQNKKREK